MTGEDGLQLLQAASMAIAQGKGGGKGGSISDLLNPAPAGAVAPSGFVLGKDGKLKKKRGRKPTPGLTDEDRRQARLLKNRRTAESSRRRKMALLVRLTKERDEAVERAEELRRRNEVLRGRLESVLGRRVEEWGEDLEEDGEEITS